MKIIIDGKQVPQPVIAGTLEQLLRSRPELDEASLQKEAENTIVRQFLLREAAKSEIDEVPEKELDREIERIRQQCGSEASFQQMCVQHGTSEGRIRDEIRGSLAISIYLRKQLPKTPSPSDKILREFFARSPHLAQKPLEVHAAHIVRKPDPKNPNRTYNEMLKLRKQLLDGANFAELASANSECNDKGGDLGFFAPGRMVEEFDTVVFSMNVGEISPVFRTPFGYHIATVYEIKAAGKRDFEECREDVLRNMQERLREQQIDKLLAPLREKAKIEVCE